MRVILNIDGGSRGSNPGMAAIGFVIRDCNEILIGQGGTEIGWATNNEAEYSALIAGLHNCHLLGATEVVVRSDSQLLVRQMQGQYRVKQPHLQEYHREAHREAERFHDVEYRWVSRKLNTVADGIARRLLAGETSEDVSTV